MNPYREGALVGLYIICVLLAIIAYLCWELRERKRINDDWARWNRQNLKKFDEDDRRLRALLERAEKATHAMEDEARLRRMLEG